MTLKKPPGASHYWRGVGWKTPEQLAEIEAAQLALLEALDALAKATSPASALAQANEWGKKRLNGRPGRKAGSTWTVEQVKFAMLPHSAPVIARATKGLFATQSDHAAARAINRLRQEMKEAGPAVLLVEAMCREAPTEVKELLTDEDLVVVTVAALKSIVDNSAT